MKVKDSVMPSLDIHQNGYASGTLLTTPGDHFYRMDLYQVSVIEDAKRSEFYVPASSSLDAVRRLADSHDSHGVNQRIFFPSPQLVLSRPTVAGKELPDVRAVVGSVKLSRLSASRTSTYYDANRITVQVVDTEKLNYSRRLASRKTYSGALEDLLDLIYRGDECIWEEKESVSVANQLGTGEKADIYQVPSQVHGLRQFDVVGVRSSLKDGFAATGKVMGIHFGSRKSANLMRFLLMRFDAETTIGPPVSLSLVTRASLFPINSDWFTWFATFEGSYEQMSESVCSDATRESPASFAGCGINESLSKVTKAVKRKRTRAFVDLGG